MPISIDKFDSIFETFKETLGDSSWMHKLHLDYPTFLGEFRTISLRLTRLADSDTDVWITSILSRNEGKSLLLTRNHVNTEVITEKLDYNTKRQVTSFSGNFSKTSGNKAYSRAVAQNDKFNLVVVRDHQYYFSRPGMTAISAMRDLYAALEQIATDDIVILFI